MKHKKSFGLPIAFLLMASLGVSCPVLSAAAAGSVAQAKPVATPASRLTGDWRTASAVPLPAVATPQPPSIPDLGPAPANARLDRILLLLAPSAAQQQALTTQLAALQNPSSPRYHQWLTPPAFADAYANSATDVAVIAAWLQSQGLQVAPLPAGRGWIEFSGTVGQVEQAFQAQVHSAATPAGPRFILAGTPSVPAPFAPLVQGLVSLDGALSTSALTTVQPLTISAPQLAAQTSLNQAAALTPRMAASLLHIDQLQSASINGSGEIIAIAARSNIDTTDIAAFQSTFGLSGSAVKVLPNGPDPGLAADRAAATFAASWAGVAAPSALIVLVPASSTTATDGIDLSLAAIVDQALAHTVAVGYSACEAALSPAHQAFYSALYRQAAAEGISIVAASGDSGAAACHLAGDTAPVTTGLGVNALASTPWNTAVGVASFGAAGPGAGNSALAAWSPATPTDPAYAGGGGSSTLYAAPAWQPLSALPLAQVSTTGAANRLLPDLVLPTAIDSSVNPGLAFCLSGSTSSTGCTLARAGGSGASTALFAGIAALIQQKNGPQGNLAPNLYALSLKPGIFADVQQGSAQLACASGTPGCNANGQIGFSANAGYDLATGLGSIDAHALVTRWATPAATGTGLAYVTNTIALNQTINPSGSLVLSATVTSGTSGAAPTGTVSFFDRTTSTTVSVTGLTANSATGSTATVTVTGVLAKGGHLIEADYSGDTVYAPVASGPIFVDVSPSTTTTTVVPSNLNPAPGANFTVNATIDSVNAGAGAAPPSGTVNFELDGVSQGVIGVVTGTPSTSSINMTAPTGAGTHQILGIYSGDTNYTTSTSAAVTLNPTKGATTTTLTASPTALTANTPETLTATIAPTAAVTGTTATITGTVSFYDTGNKLLGTSPVSGNTAALTGVTLANNVSHSLTAVYSGDTNWLTSTSAPLVLAATTVADSVVLTANYTTVPAGAAVVLTATVTPAIPPVGGVGSNPTGSVTFYNGTTVIGIEPLTPVALSDSSIATFTTQTLPGGQDVLSAYYSGDTTYEPATSNLLTLDVQAFTITPDPSNPATNLNIVQGSAGSASFDIGGLGGFTNLVQVVCAVPVQDDMTCTATPQQVAPPGVVTFVVQTFTTGGSASTTLARNNRHPMGPHTAGGTALALLGIFLLPFGRRARIFAGRSGRRFMVLLLLLAGLGGVGVGCNSTTQLSAFGTPLGVATLKITATAYVDNTVVSQSVYLTVNVLAPGTTP